MGYVLMINVFIYISFGCKEKCWFYDSKINWDAGRDDVTVWQNLFEISSEGKQNYELLKSSE